jgi:hypothetical protein
MLVMNPDKRITVKEAINHQFFKESPAPCDKKDIPLPKQDCHDLGVRNELRNKQKPEDHKQIFTFKHN